MVRCLAYIYGNMPFMCGARHAMQVCEMKRCAWLKRTEWSLTQKGAQDRSSLRQSDRGASVSGTVLTCKCAFVFFFVFFPPLSFSFFSRFISKMYLSSHPNILWGDEALHYEQQVELLHSLVFQVGHESKGSCMRILYKNGMRCRI